MLSPEPDQPANAPRRRVGKRFGKLMARMGHASARAALIYQHATRERDALIASALSDVIDARVRHTQRL
jgi:hypothetical protein